MSTSIMSTTKGRVGWITAIVAAALMIVFIPVNDVFTYQMKAFCVITLTIIIILGFELLNNFIAGLLLPTLYVLFQVAEGTVAFSPWLSYLPWAIISALLLVEVAVRIGLLKRVSFWIMLHTGGTYKGLIWGMVPVGIVLDLLCGGCGIFVLAPIAFGMCEELDLRGTKVAAGLMFAVMFSTGIPFFFLYSPLVFGVVVASAQTVDPTIDVSFMEYFVDNIVWLGFLIILIFLVQLVFKQDVEFQGKDYFTEQLKSMGKMSTEEKKLSVIFVCLVAFLMTYSLHHITMGWGFVIAAVIAYFPGIEVGKNEDVRKVDLGLPLFVTGCLSIGTVATKIGLSSLLMKALTPMLSGQSEIMFFLMVFLIIFVLNFLMTPGAIMAIFGGLLVTMSIQMGINPLASLMLLMVCVDEVLLPYEYTHYLFGYSFGLVSMVDFIKMNAVKVVVFVAFLLVFGIPWWHLVGLL